MNNQFNHGCDFQNKPHYLQPIFYLVRDITGPTGPTGATARLFKSSNKNTHNSN